MVSAGLVHACTSHLPSIIQPPREALEDFRGGLLVGLSAPVPDPVPRAEPAIAPAESAEGALQRTSFAMFDRFLSDTTVHTFVLPFGTAASSMMPAPPPAPPNPDPEAEEPRAEPVPEELFALLLLLRRPMPEFENSDERDAGRNKFRAEG